MQKSFTEMLKDESPREYFDKQIKRELEKDGHLRDIKRRSYIDQLESMSEQEYEIFKEALVHVRTANK